MVSMIALSIVARAADAEQTCPRVVAVDTNVEAVLALQGAGYLVSMDGPTGGVMSGRFDLPATATGAEAAEAALAACSGCVGWTVERYGDRAELAAPGGSVLDRVVKVEPGERLLTDVAAELTVLLASASDMTPRVSQVVSSLHRSVLVVVPEGERPLRDLLASLVPVRPEWVTPVTQRLTWVVYRESDAQGVRITMADPAWVAESDTCKILDARAAAFERILAEAHSVETTEMTAEEAAAWQEYIGLAERRLEEARSISAEVER